MADPVITPTATAAAVSFGLTALLTGWIGQVGAEVMIVIIAAIAGGMVSLSSRKTSFWESLRFISMGVFVAAALAWAISSAIVSKYPEFASPYLPTMVAFVIGAIVDKFPLLFSIIIDKIFKKV